MAQNGPVWPEEVHFGPFWPEEDHFGPFWPEEDRFGPLRSANHTLAIPDQQPT